MPSRQSNIQEDTACRVMSAATGEVLPHDSRHTLVHAMHRLVGMIGLQDMVVVETADAVMVIERSRSQEVKTIIGALSRRQARAQLPV